MASAKPLTAEYVAALALLVFIVIETKEAVVAARGGERHSEGMD
jgi:hypothetical protein